MRRIPALVLELLLLSATAVAAGQSQPAIPVLLESTPLEIALNAGQSAEVEVRGAPQSLVLLELRIDAGLVDVTSPLLPKWHLELGKASRIRYVVAVPEDGSARLRIDSAEQEKLVDLTIERLAPQEDLALLRRAEEALCAGESTRRHQPGALAPEAALASYDRAAQMARQLRDTALLRMALTQKARYLQFGRSQFSEARGLLVEAENLASVDDVAQQAMTAKTLASAEMFLGNYDASIAAGEHALALYRQTGDRYWQGIVLGNLAAVYAETGDDERAIAAARDGLANAEAEHDSAGLVYCLSQLAAIYRQRGQFDAAFQAFRDAMAWGDRIHYAPLIEAEIEKELGIFYAQLGMWEEAESELRQCLAHVNGAEGTASLEARNALAWTIKQRHRLHEAVKEYDAAIMLAARLQLSREHALLLLGRSATLLDEGRRTEAAADVEQAAGLAGQLGAPSTDVRVGIARGAVADKPAEALRCYHEALALAMGTGQRQEQAAAWAGIATAEQRLGDSAAALQSADKALALVEQARSSLDSRDLAASYFTEHHAWYGLAIDASMRLARQHPGQGYEEIAFTWAERAHARALLESLTQSAWGHEENLSQDQRRRLALNRHAIEDAEAELTRKTASLPAVADRLRHLYEEQDALAAEARSGKTFARGAESVNRADTGRNQIEAGSVVDVGDVRQSLLGTDGALLAFWVGETHSYRWLLTKRGIEARMLPGREQLNRKLAPLLSALVLRHPAVKPGEDAIQYEHRRQLFASDRDAALLDTGRLLLAGIPKRVRTLYLVSEGDLLSLPWAALRVSCGDRTCYAVERYTISGEPSASVAVALAREQPSGKETGILVVADPVLEQRKTQLRWPELTKLSGSRQEAEAITHLANGTELRILRGADATPAALRGMNIENGPGRFGILHIAAHTILVPGHPELSGIALSQPPQTADGAQASSVLWLRDISSLHAQPLVVLSGCETVGGVGADGEGLRSLTQAFFFAGARAVVGSLWNVEDNATVELMREFYRNLLERRKSPTAALRAAQLALLRSGRSDLSTWAAFILCGVPKQPVQSEVSVN